MRNTTEDLKWTRCLLPTNKAIIQSITSGFKLYLLNLCNNFLWGILSKASSKSVNVTSDSNTTSPPVHHLQKCIAAQAWKNICEYNGKMPNFSPSTSDTFLIFCSLVTISFLIGTLFHIPLYQFAWIATLSTYWQI